MPRAGKLWWDHVPVYWLWSEVIAEGLAESSGPLIEAALALAQQSAPNGMAILPSSGFRIKISRSALARSSFVAVEEDPKLRSDDRALVLVSVEETEESLFGKENPFPEAFISLANKLPSAWPRWLQWRMSRRRKPDPPWLIELKTQRKQRKGSYSR